MNNSPSPFPQSLETTILLPVFLNLTALGNSHEQNQSFHFFCVWFISFSKMSSRFIHRPEFSSFLRLNDIPLYVNTTLIYSFIPLQIFGLLPRISNGEHCCCEHECANSFLETLLSVLCVMYSGMEFLDQMVILFKKFWVTSILILFSTMAVPFYWYIPTSRAKGLQYFHILGNICFLFFWQ